MLSIVVPVLNEEENLARLGRFRRLSMPVEWIVVDGGSSDGSVTMAAWADRVISSAPGRAVQMNAGAQIAAGTHLLFLHADSILPEDFAAFVTHLTVANPSWGFFRVRLSPSSKLLALVGAMMNIRSRLTAVATGDQGIYVRKSLFEQIGRFPVIALMEDVSLSKRLRLASRPSIWGTPITTSSRRWREHGVVRTVVLMWRLRLLYFLGVSPGRLHQHYYGGSDHE